MADKQLSLKPNADDSLFADDDPLAALAMIASFEPQGEVRHKPSIRRREPEFNLEDELLKEFDRYEEPVAASGADAATELPSSATETHRFDEEPVFGDEEPAATPAQPQPEAEVTQPFTELRAIPQPSYVGPSEPVRPASHPVFDLEDEILREFAAFDARRAGPSQPVTPAVQPAVAVQPARIEPSFVDLPTVDEAVAVPHPGYGDEDIAANDADAHSAHASEQVVAALDAMEAEVDPGRWQQGNAQIVAEEEAFDARQAVAESVEEPALFEADALDHERWEDELVVEDEIHTEPVASLPLDIDAEPDIYIPDDDLIVESEVEPIAVGASGVEPSVAPPAEPAQTGAFSLDALLADIERYPVTSTQTRWPSSPETASSPVVQKVVDAEPSRPAVEAVVEAPAAVARVEAPVRNIATAVPLSAQKPVTPANLAQPVVETPVVAAPVVAKAPIATEPKPTVAAAANEAADLADDEKDADLFDEMSFELDLTEIELDMLEMEVESAVASPLKEEQVAASRPVRAEVARLVVEEKPVRTVERNIAPQPVLAEDYSSLPFDPSQVVTEEETVEAIAEMDVPETPVVDHDIPAPTQPDYDIDIDAEMAHIFARPVEQPRSAAAAARAAQQQPATAAASTSAVDLDEFEKALEEDFRRSLTENRATSTPDRVALTPSSYDEARQEGATGRRILVLAASVAGLVLIGGAGVYAFWGNSSPLLSASGEPRIILADKGPVKVEPKDRGGQVVPNQDKAVYDRVSGEQKDDATKQDRLVSSNEEPVDVVQKTLMPENLPMDEDQPSATDTSDTTDPRLLPENQSRNVSTDQASDGVSPRKVRTMVVRSDGTLVAREDEPASDGKDLTPAEASQERSLDVNPAVENVPERLSANDDVAKQIKEASSDTTILPDVQKPADAKVANAGDNGALTEDPAPVTEDQTAKADQQTASTDDAGDQPDTAPVVKQDLATTAPASDTADQSTDTTANTAADAAADTAANDAKPADQSATVETVNDDAVKDAALRANTPIPQTRPVDQPVDIVGRVNNDADAQKSEQVASAETTTEPVQTTATPAGAYVIQIASLPSEAEAQQSYTKLSARFANVLGGHGVDIRKAEIKNKGTYYRVRIVAGSRQEATDLCSRYKAAGGSCLVSK